MRKIYDSALGAVGTEFEESLVETFNAFGIKVLEQVGKTIDPKAPADITILLRGKSVKLQLERRAFVLEKFSTIHLPDESLDFDLLVEESSTGCLFVTRVQFVKASPKVIVPNKYDGGKSEQFYDISTHWFEIFTSREDFCRRLDEWYFK